MGQVPEALRQSLRATRDCIPAALKMFGGKYDPTKLRFPLKFLIGEVPASDIRSWATIRAWAAD